MMLIFMILNVKTPKPSEKDFNNMDLYIAHFQVNVSIRIWDLLREM